jgi:protein-disulfide isomerase
MKNISCIFLYFVVIFCTFLPNYCISADSVQDKKLTGEALKQFFAYKEGERYFGIHPKGAKVTLVTYGALTCPHCSDFFLKTIPLLKSKYFDKGKSFTIIHRSFIADAPSLTAMMILECKAHSTTEYNKILSTLYSSQLDWAFTPSFKDKLYDIFTVYKYNKGEIFSCMNDHIVKMRLIQDRIDVIEKGGLHATPMILINGKMLIDISLSSIEREIVNALNA